MYILIISSLYTQSHTYMSVSMLSSLTHHPKALFAYVIHLSILRGSRGQNVVLHHRHSAPHVLLNAFQSLSKMSKRFEKEKPKRKTPIDLIWFIWSLLVFFVFFWYFLICFDLFCFFWSFLIIFLIPRLICPSFFDKTLTDKSWYGNGRWHLLTSQWATTC